MKIKMTRNNRGFTIVEIIVVLLLISIIAAATFRRSITTDQMNLVSQFDKIQNQIRYPQSMAMKHADWWGFSCNTTDYWIFTGTNQTANHELLPGQQQALISLNDLGVKMDGFAVVFDKYGIPYLPGPPDWPTLMSAELKIKLSESGSGPGERWIKILPQTGLVK
jgi:prepilin-type N-terminal cleavage/methylation domain-containing protein